MWLIIFLATAHNKVPTTCCTTSTSNSGCHRVVTRLHLVVTWQCLVSEMIHWLCSYWLLQDPLGCYKVVLPCNMVAVISIWDVYAHSPTLSCLRRKLTADKLQSSLLFSCNVSTSIYWTTQSISGHACMNLVNQGATNVGENEWYI